MSTDQQPFGDDTETEEENSSQSAPAGNTSRKGVQFGDNTETDEVGAAPSGTTPRKGVQCTATSKQSGNQCRRWAKPGLTVCVIHGAGTAKAKAKAAANLQAAAAVQLANRIGVKIEVSPQQALLDEVHRTAGMVAFYQEQVQNIVGDDPDLLVRSITKTEETQARYAMTVTTTESVAHMWLQLYNAERVRLVQAAAAAVRAGVEERRVELAEQQGQLMVTVIRAILARLHLNPEQQALVPTVVPEELRALAIA